MWAFFIEDKTLHCDGDSDKGIVIKNYGHPIVGGILGGEQAFLDEERCEKEKCILFLQSSAK